MIQSSFIDFYSFQIRFTPSEKVKKDFLMVLITIVEIQGLDIALKDKRYPWHKRIQRS